MLGAQLFNELHKQMVKYMAFEDVIDWINQKENFIEELNSIEQKSGIHHALLDELVSEDAKNEMRQYLESQIKNIEEAEPYVKRMKEIISVGYDSISEAEKMQEEFNSLREKTIKLISNDDNIFYPHCE